MQMTKTIAKWVAGAAIAGAMLFAAPRKAEAQSWSFGVSVGNGGYYSPYAYGRPAYRPYYSGYYPSYYGTYYPQPYYGHSYVRPYYGHPVPRGNAYGYYRHHR